MTDLDPGAETLDVAVVLGVPEIRPVVELIDRPAGRPVALYVSVWPDAESVAAICRLAALPTVPAWLPGLVTVTTLPAVPTFQVKVADLVGPCCRAAEEEAREHAALPGTLPFTDPYCVL